MGQDVPGNKCYVFGRSQSARNSTRETTAPCAWPGHACGKGQVAVRVARGQSFKLVKSETRKYHGRGGARLGGGVNPGRVERDADGSDCQKTYCPLFPSRTSSISQTTVRSGTRTNEILCKPMKAKAIVLRLISALPAACRENDGGCLFLAADKWTDTLFL